MATSTTQELAQLLTEHRPEWDGAGFPPWLRARVAAHVVNMRAEGASIAALGSSLGVSAPTLRRWMEAPPLTDEPGGFTRVIVDDNVAASEADLSNAVTTPLRLTTPGGFVLEGLTFEQSITALAALR